MQTEILIYGIAPGETERHTEALLACFPTQDQTRDTANIERVKTAAGADGYHSFRITGFVPGTIPNFA